MYKTKFRVWDTRLKEMHSWKSVLEDVQLLKSAFTVEHLVLLQYTGLKDQNDDEIYVGDVVRTVGNTKTSGTIQDDGRTLWNIIDKDLMFSVDRNYFNPSIELYPVGHDAQTTDMERVMLWLWHSDGGSDGLEIVGNIHDNPELLKA